MAPQYSLYVLQKHCDRRDSYWIANYYEILLINEVKRANNEPLRGMGGRAETTAKRSARTSSKWTFIHRYCGMQAGWRRDWRGKGRGQMVKRDVARSRGCMVLGIGRCGC